MREVLQAKYGIRHVPVVEIGDIEKGIYQAVTEIGIEHLEKVLFEKEEVK
ncbi:glutaredoxin family protein [Listeria monocytogenes FSL F2-208]|nr:glutaredoxin family protein [Listeria monocytogenes FSL F2-208]